MIELRFESRLAVSAPVLWARVSTLDGVNEELGPWLSMSYPPARASLQDVTPAPLLFSSWVRLFGVLPVDRHHLGLERLYPEQGFDERSSSWSQRLWIHRRRLHVIEGGVRVTDELVFEPRLAAAGAMLKSLVGAVFRHRHRRLRARYGELEPE